MVEEIEARRGDSARVQGMVRSIDQYRNCDPKAIADGSYAQVLYALTDDKHDILVLWDFAVAAARQAEALKREIAEKDARIAALEAGISDLVEIARQGVPSIPPDGPTTPEHQAAYEATGFTFVEIRSRARALLSKESDDAGGSTITTTGTDEACPGEHQEVLDAIQSHNSGEDE